MKESINQNKESMLEYNPLQPGQIHELLLESRQQRYTLAVPTGYSDSTPVPLVIALHWGGPVTPFYGKSFLIGLVEPALRELGALIVAPDCQHGQWDNPQSEREIMTLLNTLQANYNIDTNKIILTGYSKGGKGVWYLAARNQDKFTAAIPIAAPPQPDSTQVKWQIPLYVIHSRQDELFPIGVTAEAVNNLQEQGHDVTFVALDKVTHHDAGGFLEPLRAAVPWLRSVRARDGRQGYETMPAD